ncbi:hypothetical protein D9619_008933 [Psilocybe cf. subviscida]|uniref:Uncharacterized protein n=1 Tax=Psilocybe cf. subviscida TaxID=2480587 RepID=A0A8H5FA37_9AGAR|nr:hypothetical protein D9619_008933 [Psilocybe cf. subviscida]
MAHHTHFSHPQTLDADHIFERQPQCCGESAWTCPGTLVHHIDRWLWLNVLVSLCALAAILASTGHRWLVFILTTSTIRTKNKAKILRSQKPLDRATAFTIVGLIVAGLFYTCILLILSRRERYITEQASAAQTISVSSNEDSIEALDVLEDAADESSRITERESVVFLMLVVCQNGLAALLLYVGIRVMFLLKSSATELWSMSMYIELGYTLGQIALMTFVIVHCTMQDDKLGEYLRARQGVQSPQKRLGWFDHEEEAGYVSNI